MTKTFTVAGVSYHKGAWAVRYTNSMGRASVLARNGHAKIKLYKLPYAGAKEDAVDFLLNKAHDMDAEAFRAVEQEAESLGFRL